MMKKMLSLLLVAIVALGGCTNDDLDAIRAEQADLQERVSALEDWQKTVNANISSLQSIVSALSESDYVQSVSPLADGSGYVINFVKSGAVTIRHGEKGATGDKGETGAAGTSPQISVGEDGGVYYWKLNGEWLLDASGYKLRVTGEKGEQGAQGEKGEQGEQGEQGIPGTAAIAPQVRINTDSNMWEISVNGGTSWTSTGVKAIGVDGAQGIQGIQGEKGEKGEQGDAIFQKDGIATHDNYVELTLANGTTLQLPRYKAFSIGTDAKNKNAALDVYLTSNQISLDLPSGFKESDYTAIMAQVISDRGTSTDIKTRAATNTPWTVTVEKPTFNADGTCKDDATVTVTPPATGIAIGETAVLEVTLVGNDGSKTVATRALTFAPRVGDFYCRDDAGKGYFISGDAPTAGHQYVGMVFYMGQHESDNADYSTTGIGQQKCHGYVMALRDVNNDTFDRLKWENKDGICDQSVGASTDETDWNGYSNTQKIVEYVNTNSGSGWQQIHFPAANGCLLYGTESSLYDWQKDYAAPSNSSGWFLLSVGQLKYLYDNRTDLSSRINSLSTALSNTNITWFTRSIYWSSSEQSSYNNRAYYVGFGDGSVASSSKEAVNHVRALCAF